MRIAALSDIHGNVWALEAVLADVKRQGVDLTVNLGDILSGPLEPAATADLLMSLSLPTIRGNHERQLLDCERQPGGASDQFAYEHTTAAHRDWLRTLPPVMTLPGGIFLCHGTPASDLVYFLEHLDAAGARLADNEEIERHAQGIEHSLILCGHSHKPRTCAISGDRLVVNPGSVGLQAYSDSHVHSHKIENGSPHARYAICESTPAGWQVEQRCVAYDFSKAAATARRNGSDKWAALLASGRA
jgi:predicted phosphodiesterase